MAGISDLFMDPIVYIRFLTQFSPILFSFIAVIDSAYNMSLKGILYVFGVTLTLSIGKLFSASFPFRVPGVEDGMNEKDFATSNLKSDKYAFDNAKYHPSCNLISKPDHAGWGTFYSSPDMYALYYTFTIVYIINSMFNGNDVNIFILSILMFFFFLSSYFRTQVFYCVEFRDILVGMVIGGFIGFLWFIFVSITEKSLKIYDLTYFNVNRENNNKCKIKNKQFRCKRVKQDVEKDNQINNIKTEAAQQAKKMYDLQNKLDKEDNFTAVWSLYKKILVYGEKNRPQPLDLLPDIQSLLETFRDSGTKLNELFNNDTIKKSIRDKIMSIYGVIDIEYDLSKKSDNDSLYFEDAIGDELFKIVWRNITFFNAFLEKTLSRANIDEEIKKILQKIKNEMETIKNNINEDSTIEEFRKILPINILYETLKDPNDYIKIANYLDNN